MSKFVVAPHFRLQEWVAEEKGYFSRRRPRLRIPRDHGFELGQRPSARQQGRRLSDARSGPHLQCQRRLPLDHERRRLQRPRQALRRLLFGFAMRRVRAGGFAGQDAGGSRRRADLGRLSVRQPLCDDPGPRTVSQARSDQPVVQRRAVVQPHGDADRRQGAGGIAVQRPVLFLSSSSASAKSSTPRS